VTPGAVTNTAPGEQVPGDLGLRSVMEDVHELAYHVRTGGHSCVDPGVESLPGGAQRGKLRQRLLQQVRQFWHGGPGLRVLSFAEVRAQLELFRDEIGALLLLIPAHAALPASFLERAEDVLDLYDSTVDMVTSEESRAVEMSQTLASPGLFFRRVRLWGFRAAGDLLSMGLAEVSCAKTAWAAHCGVLRSDLVVPAPVEHPTTFIGALEIPEVHRFLSKALTLAEGHSMKPSCTHLLRVAQDSERLKILIVLIRTDALLCEHHQRVAARIQAIADVDVTIEPDASKSDIEWDLF
jgi:hypothetical protein